jgi:uncharacterized protein
MATPPSGPSPPPGWYADPQGGGGQRFWDGSRWTEHATAPVMASGAGLTSDREARNWALAGHLSALAGIVVGGLIWLGPLIVYLVKKDAHPYIREHAREALNFNLSIFLYLLVGGIITFFLVLFLVGLLLIPIWFALAIAWLVLTIVGAVKASNGEQYRYPLTIRFLS